MVRFNLFAIDNYCVDETPKPKRDWISFHLLILTRLFFFFFSLSWGFRQINWPSGPGSLNHQSAPIMIYVAPLHQLPASFLTRFTLSVLLCSIQSCVTLGRTSTTTRPAGSPSIRKLQPSPSSRRMNTRSRWRTWKNLLS